MKQILTNLSRLLIFLILIIVFLSSLFNQIYDINYFEKKYQQYNVYDNFSKEKAYNATVNIFKFFKNNESLDANFFNDDEIKHLEDVRIILHNINIIYYGAIILFWLILLFIYFYYRKKFMLFFVKSLFYSGIFAISLIILVSIFYFIFGFDFLFLKFHELFFIGNYAFDPAVSNMKALFPNEFFFDMGKTIIFKILIKSILLSIFSYILLKKKEI